MMVLRRVAAAAVALALAASAAGCDPERGGGGRGGLPPCTRNCKNLIVSILGTDGADTAHVKIVLTQVGTHKSKDFSPKRPAHLPHIYVVSYSRDGTFQVHVEARPTDEGRVKIEFRTRPGGPDLCNLAYGRQSVCVHLTPR